MRKYNVIGVHRDTGFIRGFTLGASDCVAEEVA